MSNSAATLNLDLLNDAIDAEGVGVSIPQNAIGVMGQPGEKGIAQVIRSGQIVEVKPGEFLLKGDVIRTGISKGQEIFLSASNPGALTKVVLSDEQEILLEAGQALELTADAVELPVTEALTVAANGAETSGLFGLAGMAGLSGSTVAVATGGLALAAVGSGGGDDATGNSGTGTGAGGGAQTGDGNDPGNEAPPPAGGMFSSGGAMLDALPLINMNPTPVTFESLGQQFDANAPASDAGLPGLDSLTGLLPAGASASPLSALAGLGAPTEALAPVLNLL